MPCFTNGTFITTLRGEIPVEKLAAGDRIVTRDNGLQTVRRVHSRTFDFGQLAVIPHLQPILVTVGSLGRDLPERDMLLSPNTRMLVSADRLPFSHTSGQALVAVKNLIDHHAIRRCSVLGVVYVHVELFRHEVILANGAWVEAFQPGDLSLGPIGNAQRNEINELGLHARVDKVARDGVA